MVVRRSKAAIYYRVLAAQRLQRSHLDLVPAGRLFRLTAELVMLKSRSCDRLSRDQRNSLPSAQMRCMIIASLRATATTARLRPRRLATATPHAFNLDQR
jgi:hypothetical protein